MPHEQSGCVVSSAREQAQKAIAEKCPDDWVQLGLVAELADTASDVWEPIVRDLLVAYKHAVEYEGKGHVLDSSSIFAWGGYIRALEAMSD